VRSTKFIFLVVQMYVVVVVVWHIKKLGQAPLYIWYEST